MTVLDTSTLARAWKTLRPHPEQGRLWASKKRFRVVAAGRRSGKTELAKRHGVLEALTCPVDDGWVVFAAPTYNQAKRLYWRGLLRLIPSEFIKSIQKSELIIELINGCEIQVMGLDVPERIEGRTPGPWWIGLDEFANMHQEVFDEHVGPALADVGGSAWLYGVPEGRNHFWEKFDYALSSGDPEWDAFTWSAEDILPQSEIDSLKRRLDELTYDQEVRASFVSFMGRAYHQFQRAVHANKVLEYKPGFDVGFCFDFNASPGVASVIQDIPRMNKDGTQDGTETSVIGEVWIPRHSNTDRVCDKLIEDWAPRINQYGGRVKVYADATGGAKGSAKVKGSDIDLIKMRLKPVFGDRLLMRVPLANPSQRARVNAVNSRLRSASGDVRMWVCPRQAPHAVRDFEGVRILEGSAGEIDKDSDPNLTHVSDGLGYFVHKQHPIVKGSAIMGAM